MSHSRIRAFTIIELVVVIGVIGILVTIVGASYLMLQAKANNTQVKDGAVKFAGAIELLAAKYSKGALPPGGTGSTSTATATGCTNGAGGWQAAAYPGVQCTLGDAVIATKYLPANFFDGMPLNTTTGAAKNSYMVQQCSDGNYLLYFQENPSSSELQRVADLVAGVCAAKAADINGRGMAGYIKLKVS